MSTKAKNELGAILSRLADAQAAARAKAMPTEVEAVRQLTDALHRLEELGWRKPVMARDGDEVLVVSAFSSGRHKAAKIDINGRDHCWEHWDGEDSWTIEPLLWRPLTKEEQASGTHTFGLDHGGPTA